MNRERAKELLPIIEAFANGVDIEWRMDDEEWDSSGEPYWGDHFKYRIKPKPREFWIRVNANNDIIYSFVARPVPYSDDVIKVREVIE